MALEELLFNLTIAVNAENVSVPEPRSIMWGRRWRLPGVGRLSPPDTEPHGINMTIHNSNHHLSLDHIASFVRAVFGIDVYVANEWPGFDAYLDTLKEQAQYLEDDRFSAFWQFLDSSLVPNFNAILKFLAVVASVWRENQTPDPSIDETLAAVANKYNADLSRLDSDTKKEGRRAVFGSLIWLTLLAKPSWATETNTLAIVLPSNPKNVKTSQSIEMSKRPFASVLRGFGHLLPPCQTLSSNIDNSPSLSLHASSISYHSLKNVAKVRIQWTSALSCHLMFYPSSRSLLMFAFPTLCALSLRSAGDSAFER